VIRCRAPSNHELHYTFRALAIKRNDILVYLKNQLVDKAIIVLYRAPPKAKYLFVC
jgi:hypothetical protein